MAQVNNGLEIYIVKAVLLKSKVYKEMLRILVNISNPIKRHGIVNFVMLNIYV